VVRAVATTDWQIDAGLGGVNAVGDREGEGRTFGRRQSREAALSGRSQGIWWRRVRAWMALWRRWS